MQLFEFTYQEYRVQIELDLPLQLERVLINGAQVSIRPLSESINTHKFHWHGLGDVVLEFGLNAETQQVHFQLGVGEQVVQEGVAELSVEARAQLFGANSLNDAAAANAMQTVPASSSKPNSLVALGGVAFKL